MLAARFCAALVLSGSLCAAIQPDTKALAADLARIRQGKQQELSRADYTRLRKRLLSWVDVRVKAGRAVARMNEELEAAKLLAKDLTPGTPFDSDVGYLGGIGEEKLEGGPGADALGLGIPVGANCDFDETVVLYDARSHARIAHINAEDSFLHGYSLRAVAVSRDRTFIASGWVAANCSSNWNGEWLRIDQPAGGPMLTRAIAGYAAEPMTIDISGDVVTFRYEAASGDPDLLTRKAIARYQIHDGHATRLAPIATSFVGFISEWLDLDDTEAARWASPEAARHHHETAVQFQKQIFEYKAVADCPGPPPTREIAVEGTESHKRTIFRVGGFTPSEMKMEAVTEDPAPRCVSIDIEESLDPIGGEPGW